MGASAVRWNWGRAKNTRRGTREVQEDICGGSKRSRGALEKRKGENKDTDQERGIMRGRKEEGENMETIQNTQKNNDKEKETEKVVNEKNKKEE